MERLTCLSTICAATPIRADERSSSLNIQILGEISVDDGMSPVDDIPRKSIVATKNVAIHKKVKNVFTCVHIIVTL